VIINRNLNFIQMQLL